MISQKQIVSLLRKLIGPAKMHPIKFGPTSLRSGGEVMYEFTLPTVCSLALVHALKKELKSELVAAMYPEPKVCIDGYCQGETGSIFQITITPAIVDQNVIPISEPNEKRFLEMQAALATLFPRKFENSYSANNWSISSLQGLTPADRPELKQRSFLLIGVEAVVEEINGNQILWFKRKERK